jgi:hypothetical protein
MKISHLEAKLFQRIDRQRRTDMTNSITAFRNVTKALNESAAKDKSNVTHKHMLLREFIGSSCHVATRVRISS